MKKLIDYRNLNLVMRLADILQKRNIFYIQSVKNTTHVIKSEIVVLVLFPRDE